MTMLFAFATFMPSLGFSEVISEPLDQMRTYILLGAILILSVFVISKSWIIAGFFAFFAATHLYIIMQAYPSATQQQPCVQTTESASMLTYNIFFKNRQTDEIIANILAQDADIVSLQEGKTPFLEESYGSLIQKYSYAYPDVSKGEFFSPAIFSKYPITKIQKPKMPMSAKRFLQATIDINGTPIEVIAIHAVSPKNAKTVKSRNTFFQDLANYVQNLRYENKNFIIAGDFNSVPWHPKMLNIQKQGGLTGNPSIANFFGTWPNWGAPFISVPIDHIFTSEGIKKISYKKVNQSAGSDHFPVKSHFEICK